MEILDKITSDKNDNNLLLSSQTPDVNDYASQLIDQAARLAVLQDVLPDEILIPNSEIWDNNLAYTAQTAGAKTEADLLFSGGNDSGQKLVIDGVSFVNRIDNATWRLTITSPGSQDYKIQNI